jgi:hypothetical protein
MGKAGQSYKAQGQFGAPGRNGGPRRCSKAGGKTFGFQKRGLRVCGDHEVVSEGVCAYPQEVTGLMVSNFLDGGAAINVLARCAGAEVSVIDIGMKEDLEDAGKLIKRNVKRAAANIARGPAMSLVEAGGHCRGHRDGDGCL